MSEEKSSGVPEAPETEAYFGQPESCRDLVNQYGTYNVQRTCESENLFPSIAHALPRKWQGFAVGKEELEGTARTDGEAE